MAGSDERQAQIVSNIAARACYNAGFQTRLGRRFTPGRFRGSTERQVWKPTLLKLHRENLPAAADDEFPLECEKC